MGTGLRWKGSRVAVYVFYYCRRYEWPSDPEGGDGFKVEGESGGCICFSYIIVEDI